MNPPDAADLADRLGRLEAKAAITDLLTRYTIAVDEYDIDAVAYLFTDDCVTDYGPGRGGLVVGRDDVRARIRRGQSEFRLTHHQHGQVLITFTGETTADVVSYLTAWHERWNGSRERVRLRYIDRVVDGDAGWRIAERRVVASGVEGFEGVEWVWVDRALPDDRS